jgi:hypothetical protein
MDAILRQFFDIEIMVQAAPLIFVILPTAEIKVRSGQGDHALQLLLSTELRRHAIKGPTPVSSSRNSPMGTFTRLKNGASTLIFSPVTASEITGNRVPQRTAKQLASRIRLLKRKLDSRERTLSSCASLFR